MESIPFVGTGRSRFKPTIMCGIVAMINSDPEDFVADELLEGLSQLQHRGQNGCGIVTAVANGKAHCRRGDGSLYDVFKSSARVAQLSGSMALGHVRYPTDGSLSVVNSQPIGSSGKHQIFMAHNGRVTHNGDAVHLRDLSDSYLILATLAEGLENIDALQKRKNRAPQLVTALQNVYSAAHGAFACVALIDSSIMVGFRDPWGIKPLIWGKRRSKNGSIDVCFASESVVLERMGFTDMEDVRPGEAVSVEVLTPGVDISRRQVVSRQAYAPDIFEYVYFARPESIIDGIDVYQVREHMGHALGQVIAKRLDMARRGADVIVPVPETSYISAIAAAVQMNLPCALGFTKNRYSNRTFTLPSQKQRIKAVREKFGIVRSAFRHKDVIIVDDSIVRGTTSREIVRMARNAGAKSIVFASASPAIRFRHIHGIDLSHPKDLIAHNRREEEVSEAIGADMVVYLPLDMMIESCVAAQAIDSRVTSFEAGVFTGHYTSGKAPPCQCCI